jgi:O-antigen ligase
MKAVESSLSYRSVRAASGWVGRAVRWSATGGSLGRAVQASGAALAGSRVFGAGRIASPRLEDGSPRSLLAGGVAGRTLQAAAAAAPSSVFAGGGWLRLAGAGLVGLGCGMLSSRVLVSIVLILAGLLLALAGPSARAVVGESATARLARRRRTTSDEGEAAGDSRTAARAVSASRAGIGRTTWFAMLLSAVAGVLAGAAPGSGTRTVLALAFALAAAGLVLWRPEVILLVVATFPLLDWAARGAQGGLGPLWDDALLVVSVGLLLWSVLVLGRGSLCTVPIALPLLFTLAAAIGSMVVRKVPNGVALYGLRVLFEPMLFYFIGFLFPKNRRWVRATIAVFLLTCTTLALHGLYQYLTHAPMPGVWLDARETGIAVRAYSVVQNPNVLGALLAMGALISGSLALSRAFQGVRRLLLAAVCLVQLAGLAVTFSRGAWLGLVAGLLAMVVLAYRRYLVAVLAAGAVVWFTAPRVFVERLLFAFTSTYAMTSSAGLGRLYRWDVSLHHILDHPLFGVGLGTFGGTAAYMFGYWALWVDNFYIQMAAEGGLLLLVFFLWLLLRGAKGLVRGHRFTSDPYLKALTAGMFGAFLAVAVANAFEADWETLSVGVEYWFLAGLVTSAALEARTAQRSEAAD